MGLVSRNSRNVTEALRRNEVLRRNAAHEYESSSRPERKRNLIRNLAKFITGRGEEKTG